MDDLIYRTAKAIWIAQGGVPERFVKEWGLGGAMRGHWTSYAVAALTAAGVLS